jgi:hypothetical protein
MVAANARVYVPEELAPLGDGYMSHPVIKAKLNALITCAPGPSYTHA